MMEIEKHKESRNQAKANNKRYLNQPNNLVGIVIFLSHDLQMIGCVQLYKAH